MNQRHRGDIIDWLHCEIDARQSCYNQSFDEAKSFVLDLLIEGEYDSELNDSQVEAAKQLLLEDSL